MKEYTSNEPVFSASIQITETTDPAHADNINSAPKQLLQNTLALKSGISEICEPGAMESIFYQIFTDVKESDPTAMTHDDVREALSTEWSGESSMDPEAMTSEDVEGAVMTEWKGESSPDPEAMAAQDVEDATEM